MCSSASSGKVKASCGWTAHQTSVSHSSFHVPIILTLSAIQCCRCRSLHHHRRHRCLLAPVGNYSQVFVAEEQVRSDQRQLLLLHCGSESSSCLSRSWYLLFCLRKDVCGNLLISLPRSFVSGRCNMKAAADQLEAATSLVPLGRRFNSAAAVPLQTD